MSNEMTAGGAGLSTTTNAGLEPKDLLLQRLDQLEAALLANDPLMPGHLREIHKFLQEQPELLHVLKPEEIGITMQAMQKYTGIALVQDKIKAPAARGGRAPKITVNDIL